VAKRLDILHINAGLHDMARTPPADWTPGAVGPTNKVSGLGPDAWCLRLPSVANHRPLPWRGGGVARALFEPAPSACQGPLVGPKVLDNKNRQGVPGELWSKTSFRGPGEARLVRRRAGSGPPGTLELSALVPTGPPRGLRPQPAAAARGCAEALARYDAFGVFGTIS
jgi:hypothetical protein